jgi:hypothetical protein
VQPTTKGKRRRSSEEVGRTTEETEVVSEDGAGTRKHDDSDGDEIL